ncbi:MAG: hypothetical protein AB1346_04090 [Thermodesulfobacteriota bacterium]
MRKSLRESFSETEPPCHVVVPAALVDVISRTSGFSGGRGCNGHAAGGKNGYRGNVEDDIAEIAGTGRGSDPME